MALRLIVSYVSGSCILIALPCGVWAVLEVWFSERHGLNHRECMNEFIVISILDLGFDGFIKIGTPTGDGRAHRVRCNWVPTMQVSHHAQCALCNLRIST